MSFWCHHIIILHVHSYVRISYTHGVEREREVVNVGVAPTCKDPSLERYYIRRQYGSEIQSLLCNLLTKQSLHFYSTSKILSFQASTARSLSSGSL
jgi:hypothetical protein